MNQFPRINRLPPYVFNTLTQLKTEARARGEDIIDFGMGNPDQPTPPHIVNKLIEAVQRPDTHRYSMSKGIPRLRRAMASWYERNYNVHLNSETQILATIGSKEGLAHLALAISGPGDTILVPDPAYPIHTYGFIIAGANVKQIPLINETQFLASVEDTINRSLPKPKALVINFPANPSTHCVDYAFFEQIVNLAKKHEIWVIHDLAYADIVFDGYKAPSILQVPGAVDIAIETYSMSKSYNMPGWRIGFACGNEELVAALTRIKSYLDYGTFTPIQVAAIAALEGSDECVREIRDLYEKRRNILCDGLNELGWTVERPKATMFVWAPIPPHYKHMGSLEFSKYLLQEAHVAVSPGIGFGQQGDDYVRFGLIENKDRMRQALRNLKALFKKDGLIKASQVCM
ncbi:alanine transaminase [Legionella longbeachae]|uniref:Aminotransferase n=1 Tax=Legionella longbeachae serogroup 1 (strain NSW150) TaxID=661367 RepID=D3HT81_LEGLN|nr:alanine transaminase [Legionella longbeachae]VEE02615.1 aminotransferase, PLP-dependent [Legionella oakridgensis]HBD7397877.1 alanine transaminase [Legionella pneumophila]ARB91119.1 alanine transaminase [Legionella longbeachae]ARM32453.1 alanine transaminase [Legionella longbeachae]EEZ94736.1 aminotransferase [Legionella longbeachae D-4968]